VISSYPSIYALGHKAVALLFEGNVTVQEKVDGSQISFGRYPTLIEKGVVMESTLKIRSKGAEILIEAPDKMFSLAVAEIKAIAEALVPGWTYRGEYLAKPKHNTLVYDRVPRKHIILFDIDCGEQDYMPWSADDVGTFTVPYEADRLVFEAVAVLNLRGEHIAHE